MKYVDIKGKSISNFTLGTVQLGMDYGIANEQGKPSKDKSFRILNAALSGGITSLDTAEGYGDSEQIIGEFLHNNKNFAPYITTKFMLPSDKSYEYNEIEKYLYSFVEGSLKRLQRDYLDCLMLHRASNLAENGEKICKALKKLISEGIINNVGVSVYTDVEIERVLQYPLFESIQLPVNMFDRRLIDNGTIRKLGERKINVFARSIFFQGVFFLKPDSIKNAELKKLTVTYLTLLKEIAETENKSINELAIAYIRDLEGITSLVMGAEDEEQVTDDIRQGNTSPLKAETVAMIESGFKDVNIIEIMKILAKSK